jgi:F-type H+-transporting ATPase subunit beta
MQRTQSQSLGSLCLCGDRAVNTGVVVSVRGRVVDIRFPRRLPELYNRLNAGDDSTIVIEVVTHLNGEGVGG